MAHGAVYSVFFIQQGSSNELRVSDESKYYVVEQVKQDQSQGISGYTLRTVLHGSFATYEEAEHRLAEVE